MSDSDTSIAVDVKLFNDRANKETTVSVTPTLAALFAYADHWSRAEFPSETSTLGFSSMLAAMAAGHDPLCAWLRAHLALRGAAGLSVTRGRAFFDTPLPKSRLQTTVSFRQALAKAEELAGGQPLDVRHFMAAYVVVEKYHRVDFLRHRIDRRAWCLELAEELKRRFPGEAAQWSKYAETAPPVLLPGYDADLPSGPDLLGMGREIEAFAMLIAGRETLTPLSVGVFGAWGAGKSYFMAQLEDRVAALTLGTTADRSLSPYLKEIAQVRFNAWHYSETNVVASLVDHLFRNLHVEPNETEQTLAARRAEVLSELAAAEGLRNRLRTKVVEAEALRGKHRDALNQATRDMETAIRQKEHELSRAGDSLAEVQSRLERAARKQEEAVSAALRAAPVQEAATLVMRKLFEDDRLKQLEGDVGRVAREARWFGLNALTIAWGVVALFVAGVTAFAVEEFFASRLLTGVVGAVAAVTPVVLKWWSTLRDVAERGSEYQKAVRERAEATAREIEAEGKKEREALEEQLKSRLKEVSQLRAEIATLAERTGNARWALADSERRSVEAASALETATVDLAVKQAKLASITPGSLLEETVQGLAAANLFKKELGTLARARREFERLSGRMAATRKDFEEGRSGKRPVLERIVLYIDDLDRCPEEKVRDLLQAVHLLLAFDLFVCVVAVDPRWVIQCLKDSPGVVDRSHSPDPDLDVLGGAPTPSDYLEKIFQIPIWLRPVPPAQRAPVIGTLLGRRPKSKGGAPSSEGEQLPGATGGQERQAAPGEASRPQAVAIGPSEMEFLPRVGSLLDGNARSLKRFANTYRLVKAALSDVEFAFFSEKPYRVCMVQLAILSTQRHRARLLVRLADELPANDDLRLTDWLCMLGNSEDSEVQSLAEDLQQALLPEEEGLRFRDFSVWLERTRRYSFYL